MKPGVNFKWGRRGARAKARSSPPCSFNLLMTPHLDQEFHHLTSPQILSRHWGAPQWRSVKYEDIYVQDYGGGLDAGRGLGRWFDSYNRERPHQALDYATPADVYFDPGAHGAQPAQWESMRPEGGGDHRKT